MSDSNQKKRTRCSSGSQSTTLVEIDTDEYQCPICFEMMLGEIYQCSESHLICKTCVDKIRNPKLCPTCRVPYGTGSPMRCRIAEQLVAKMTLACQHGCGHKAKSAEMQTHMTSCLKRPVRCPLGQCNKVVPLSDLYQHCMSDHSDRHMVRTESPVTLGVNNDNMKNGGLMPYLAKVPLPLSDGGVVLFKLNFIKPNHAATFELLEVRAFHLDREFSVQVSIDDCSGKLIAQTAKVKTDAVPSSTPDSFKEQVRARNSDGPHLFLMRQIRSCIADGNFDVIIRFS
eukprot:TRINITY_DN40921_c0_g1_i1.p1 TRINITY_DN40921_c0_g1~~TRINITY_DN40921_c0_g1_i1.p1  ORF type:complete len:285 (-),score=24.82 TRINITY_DN40921_c0_g1_i1:527-1381(-)